MAQTLGFGLVCILLVACGDASNGDPNGTAGSGGGAGSGGAGGGGGAKMVPECSEGPGYQDAPESRVPGTVTANLVRIDGAPGAGVECQLCGVDVCIVITDSDELGNVTMQGDIELDTPALKVGEGLDYAKFAIELPEGTLEHQFVDQLAAELTDTLQPFETGAELGGAGVSVRLAPDGVAVVDTLSFPEPSQRTFRVVEIPADRIAEVTPADLAIEALFGMGPVQTELCPPAELTVSNSPGWEPGSAVEFWLNGTDVITEQWAPYAGWAMVSGGTVSEDGLSVSTNPGEGLPVLGVVGVRLAD